LLSNLRQIANLQPNKGTDKFLFASLIWQGLIFIAYIIIFDFVHASKLQPASLTNPLAVADDYTSYTAIVWMVFLGFGFFRTSLKYNNYTSIGKAFYLLCLTCK
jgi:hypothetical protein